MGKYSKAIMSLLGGLGTLGGLFGLNIEPEVVSAIGSLITAGLVYAVPNSS